MDEFEQWNPSLLSDCSGLTPGYYYCVANFTCMPFPSVVTTAPAPTPSGILSTCSWWYQASSGDSCDLIPQYFMNSFTSAQLMAWNPSLRSDCSGLVFGMIASTEPMSFKLTLPFRGLLLCGVRDSNAFWLCNINRKHCYLIRWKRSTARANWHSK